MTHQCSLLDKLCNSTAQMPLILRLYEEIIVVYLSNYHPEILGDRGGNAIFIYTHNMATWP